MKTYDFLILFMICCFFNDFLCFLMIFNMILCGSIYDFFMASTRGGEATTPPAVGLQYFSNPGGWRLARFFFRLRRKASGLS